VQLLSVSPQTLIGGETVLLKAKGIFNSVNKLGSLKIGNSERIIELECLDDTTLTFTAPPLLWIKQTQ